MAAKLQKIDDEIRERARAMYMERVPFNQISKELKVSTAALARWRDQDGWVATRETDVATYIEDAIVKRKVDLTEISEQAIAQIRRAVKAVADSPDISLSQAKTLAEIITMVDRVARLDRAAATENININQNISGTLTFSPERVREVIKADPFFTLPTVTDVTPKEQ